MPALTRQHGVVDEFNRIGGARILRQPVVVEVQRSRFRIDDDVLEHRAEASRRGIDLRLGLG